MILDDPARTGHSTPSGPAAGRSPAAQEASGEVSVSGGRPAGALVASDGVTTPSGGSPDDETWRRPEQQATGEENDAGASRPGGTGSGQAAPGPVDDAAGPGPVDRPADPEPVEHLANSEPVGHPADPEPLDRPANPEPMGHPANPEPVSHPAEREPAGGHPTGPGHVSHPAEREPGGDPADLRRDAPGTGGAGSQPTGSGAAGADIPADASGAAGPNSPWSREAATESPWAKPEAAGGWTVAGGPWPGRSPGDPAAGGYAGPPPSTPPPPGWRPPVHVQPAPPRQLPPQDMAAMDQAEQRAQRLTYGIGAAVAVVLVLLTCLLCSRLLF